MNAETLKEMLANATPGPWIYRPDKYDDWGTVKSGQFHICQARDPRYLDDEYLNACRGEKRDPWEANARLIALAPQLAADNIALQTEVEKAEADLIAMGRTIVAMDKELIESRANVTNFEAENAKLRELALRATDEWESFARSEYEGCSDFPAMLKAVDEHRRKISAPHTDTAAVLPG